MNPHAHTLIFNKIRAKMLRSGECRNKYRLLNVLYLAFISPYMYHSLQHESKQQICENRFALVAGISHACLVVGRSLTFVLREIEDSVSSSGADWDTPGSRQVPISS